MEEYPMGLRKEQWLEVYNHAVEGDHNFLFYDIQKPKNLRIMKNFAKLLYYKPEPRTVNIQQDYKEHKDCKKRMAEPVYEKQKKQRK